MDEGEKREEDCLLAVALQAGQNGPAKSITKSEAGTQTAQEFVELVESEKKTRSGNKSFLF